MNAQPIILPIFNSAPQIAYKYEADAARLMLKAVRAEGHHRAFPPSVQPQRQRQAKVDPDRQERNRKIVEMASQGFSVSAIVKELNLTTGTVRSVIRDAKDSIPDFEAQREERNRKIREMAANGIRNGEIAKRFGLYPSTVSKIVRGHS